MARLPYVDPDNASPEAQEVFRKLERNGARILNIYRMVGHSRAAILPFVRIGNSLLTRAELDGTLRELVILRVAQHGGAEYEWQQHVALARDVGVTDAQIAALAQWEGSSAFGEHEKAVLTFTDELTRNGDVKDDTFARVRGFLNDTEMVELTLTAVLWFAWARLMVALRIDVEEGGGVLGSTVQ